jgi:signal peptidase I
MDRKNPLTKSDRSNLAPNDNPWTETFKTIGLSVFLAFGFRTFVAQAFYIPSGSMLPTLQIDDKLIVDKISYRFANPVRGDIVVFEPTAKLQQEKDDNGNQSIDYPPQSVIVLDSVLKLPLLEIDRLSSNALIMPL